MPDIKEELIRIYILHSGNGMQLSQVLKRKIKKKLKYKSRRYYLSMLNTQKYEQLI
jgi:hypothetical protein